MTSSRLVEDYQQSPFYEKALQACPWRDTDHMGERLHNYCTWCEGFVGGAEFMAQAYSDAVEKVRRELGSIADDPFARNALTILAVTEEK